MHLPTIELKPGRKGNDGTILHSSILGVKDFGGRVCSKVVQGKALNPQPYN